ncbi:MAG: ABC transporter permease [Actinomycetota bacterium]|nr:ABC transporter permease [Actinomycetota bacterium]
MPVRLLTKTWRDHWRGLLAWTAGLVAIAAVELYVYPGIRDSSASIGQLMESYPEAFREFFRMEDYTSGVGFLNVELFSMMVPLVFIAVGATWGAAATAQEEERGTADFLLALPVGRGQVLITKMAATILALTGIALALMLTLAVGTDLVDIDIPLGHIAAACLASSLLGGLYAGIGFLLGALTGRRGVALGVAIALGLAAFLAYSLAPMVDAFDAVNPVNPFAWSVGSNPLAGGLAASDVLRLVGVSAVLYAGALLAFARHDVRT